MKKVGILTLFEGNYNYGGILQSYALCKTINNIGCDCKVIAYNNDFNPIYPSVKDQLKQYSKMEILKKVIEKIGAKVHSKSFKDIYSERRKLITDFKNTYIPHTEHYNDDLLIKESNKFDVLVSGSDQVWNPNCSRVGFLQLFPKNNFKKVSYAASISRNKLSEVERNVMIPAINDFDCIGVRELTAKKILEEDIEKDITVTLDPTLLLNKQQWLEVASDRIIKEKYVLCYFFSNSLKYRKYIEEICKEKNLKLVYIPFAKQEYNNFDDKGNGIPIKKVSPNDFLSLFNNAEYVFTDSFHGAVFSIIFEKKFFVFERDKDTKVSKNSRLYDLLDNFSLKDRLIKENNELYTKLDNNIDYNTVKNKLEEFRDISFNFLNNSLK